MEPFLVLYRDVQGSSQSTCWSFIKLSLSCSCVVFSVFWVIIMFEGPVRALSKLEDVSVFCSIQLSLSPD